MKNGNVICSPGFVIGRLVEVESYSKIEKEINSEKVIYETDQSETIKTGRRMFRAKQKEMKIQDHPYLFQIDFSSQNNEGNAPIDFVPGDVLAVSHRWAGQILSDIAGKNSNGGMGTQFDILFYEGIEYVKLPWEVFVANIKDYKDRIVEEKGKLILKSK
jgi:hypothetical protein